MIVRKSRFVEMFIGGGYREVQLGDYCEHVNNGMTRRGNDPDGSIVLRLVELQEGYIDYSSVNRIALTDGKKARYLLHDGDLLLARVNGNPDNVGRSAFFSDIGEPVYHNDHVIRATVSRNQFDPAYLVFFLNSSLGRIQIEKGLKTSAGQYTINQESVRAICLPMPPLVLQQEFAAFVAQVDKSEYEKECLNNGPGELVRLKSCIPIQCGISCRWEMTTHSIAHSALKLGFTWNGRPDCPLPVVQLS